MNAIQMKMVRNIAWGNGDWNTWNCSIDFVKTKQAPGIIYEPSVPAVNLS